MTTHDPINAYLNNEMSPDQERQFLISVASSDSLRRALKSHVMIDRIIVREEREMAVPHALRTAIFAEAGTLALLPLSNQPAATSPVQPASGSGSFRRWFGSGAIAAIGVAIGYLLAPSLPTPAFIERPVQGSDVAAPALVGSAVVPVPIPVEHSDDLAPQRVRQGNGVIVVEPRTVVRYLPAPGAQNSRVVVQKPVRPVEFAPRDNPLDPRHDNPLDPGPTRYGTEPSVSGATGGGRGPGL